MFIRVRVDWITTAQRRCWSRETVTLKDVCKCKTPIAVCVWDDCPASTGRMDILQIFRRKSDLVFHNLINVKGDCGALLAAHTQFLPIVLPEAFLFICLPHNLTFSTVNWERKKKFLQQGIAQHVGLSAKRKKMTLVYLTLRASCELKTADNIYKQAAGKNGAVLIRVIAGFR